MYQKQKLEIKVTVALFFKNPGAGPVRSILEEVALPDLQVSQLPVAGSTQVDAARHWCRVLGKLRGIAARHTRKNDDVASIPP